MSVLHSVNAKRWAKLSILEQMGNIYSEVGRSLNAKAKGDEAGTRQAMARAIDLFNTTIEQLVDEKSPKAKEVLRARDQYQQIYSMPKASAADLKSLDKYFLNFAIAARLNQ